MVLHLWASAEDRMLGTTIGAKLVIDAFRVVPQDPGDAPLGFVLIVPVIGTMVLQTPP